MSKIHLLIPALMASLACGSSTNDKPLDCAWLTSSANCYQSVSAPAQSCLPTGTGTFSADMTSCTWADGSAVTFETAVTLPLPEDGLPSFSVTHGQSPCIKIHRDPAGGTFAVTTSAGTFTETNTSTALTFTCPDGVNYSSESPLSLFSCKSDASLSFGGMPGDSFSSSANSVSYGLLSAGASGGTLQIFECSK
jgi:hypothetical protein